MQPTLLQRSAATLALSIAGALSAPTAQAADIAFSGSLVYNTDAAQIDFSLTAPGTVMLWTTSWQAGLNFDPTLALFSGNGSLLQVGDDSSDPAALLPGQGGFDGQIALPTLAAGSYHLMLSASGNDAVGPTLANGFSLAGTTPVLLAEWNQPSYDINANDQKGGVWQVHLRGVDQAAVVPEPGQWALLLLGLAGLSQLGRLGRLGRSPTPPALSVRAG